MKQAGRHSLPSTGVIKRLQAVGASIQNDEQNRMLPEIMAHLKAHPDQIEPCHTLCKSGMMIHLAKPQFAGRLIPGCTTKLSLVSHGLTKSVIMHLKPSLDMTTQGKMKVPDPASHDKLCPFVLAEEGDTFVTDKLEA